MSRLGDWASALGDADRVVPPSGFTVRLTVFTAAIMAFLTVFALALSLAAGRVAERWQTDLAGQATVRIPVTGSESDTRVQAVLDMLQATAGIESARQLSAEDQRALLAPWFGSDLPVDALPLPRLIALQHSAGGFDADTVQAALTEIAPGAVLDDHDRWRAPMVKAAERLRFLGIVALLSIIAALAAMVVLSAQAALAANDKVIEVLRLVGARDAFIVRAFTRRFTIRAVIGAAAGAVLGAAAVALLPQASTEAGFLSGLGFQGRTWLWLLLVPPAAGGLAYAATRWTAHRTLQELS